MLEVGLRPRWRSLVEGNNPTPTWVTRSLTHPTFELAETAIRPSLAPVEKNLEKSSVNFDQLRNENRDKADFDQLRNENHDKADFDQLRNENRDKVDFDQLRIANLDKSNKG